MTEQSSTEVRDTYVNAMGEGLGSVFHELWAELVWLHVKWDEFKVLYIVKPSRVDLLNRTTGMFFAMIQAVLWEDILLHMARLMDPPRSAGKETLTFKRLSGLMPTDELRASLQPLIHEAGAKTEFARDWRNRRIAHRDLNHVLDPRAKPLETARVEEVDEGLRSLAAALNCLHLTYFGSELNFDKVYRRNGGFALLKILREGNDARDARNERLKRGMPLPDDFGSDI